MPKRKPSPHGGALRYLRSGTGTTERELAEKTGVSPSVITELEIGPRELSRERLDQLLADMEIGPEAADAALLARSLAEGLPTPLSPVDPTEEEYRGIYRAALRTAGMTLEALRLELVRTVRGRRAEQDRRQAGELWATVQNQKPPRQRQIIRKDPAFWTWAFAERLCEESEKRASHSADQALQLAELALWVAERAAVPEVWRPLLLAYCWAFIGNARRVKGNLPFADEAFQRADELWQAGASADPAPLDGTRLLDLKASLRRHQGEFQEALNLLDAALQPHSSREIKARLLLKKAFTLEQQGSFETAVSILEDMADLVDQIGEPGLIFGQRFNLAVNLCHLGRHGEAQGLLGEILEIAVSMRQELHLLRVLWLKGRVAIGLNRKDEALAALEQVREKLTSRQIAYDTALVSLEIAVLWLERGRTAEVKAVAQGMAWIFKSQGLHVHALAALNLFRQAAAQETATVELVRQIHRYLEKARNNPHLPFHAGE
jgi:tetratricopeptide (TPR) repeat protein